MQDQVTIPTVCAQALTTAAKKQTPLCIVATTGTGITVAVRRLLEIIPCFLHQLAVVRSFRAPHHTVSMLGLVGAPANNQAGEIDVALGGVLYLDDFTKFGRAEITELGRVLAIRKSVGPVPLVIARADPCTGAHPPDAAGKYKCDCGARSITRHVNKIAEYCDLLGIADVVSPPLGDAATAPFPPSE